MNTAFPIKKNSRRLTLRENTKPNLHVSLALAFSVFLFTLMIAFPDTVRSSVLRSLELCATKLIPSILPFAIVGELMFSLGAGEVIGKLFGKPFESLFGISGNGAGAFLLGAVCGLPLGGRYAVILYENGDICREDCEKLLGLSNNAGLGFVIFGIGGSFFGSVRFGILLYLSQIAAATAAGIALKKRKNALFSAPITDQTHCVSISKTVTEAVSGSAFNMLKICGFVIFFGILTDVFSCICTLFALPILAQALLSAFTELTSACSIISQICVSNAPVIAESAKILLFFAVGFSGMSAHMQLICLAGKRPLGFGKYFRTKLITGIFCALLGAFAMHFIPLP